MNTLQPKLPSRFAVELDSFRALKFRERLKILIGYNLTCSVKLLVDKRDGRVWSEYKVGLTKQRTATEQQREAADE